MAEYKITQKAGRFVAGMRNPGVGTTLNLTEKQAEQPLRDGHIVKVESEASNSPKTETADADDKKAPAKKEGAAAKK